MPPSDPMSAVNGEGQLPYPRRPGRRASDSQGFGRNGAPSAPVSPTLLRSESMTLNPRPARPGLVVRDATVADFDEIQVIYAHEVLRGVATFEEVPPLASELRARWSRIRGAGLAWLVAEAEGRVVGYGYAAPYRARPAYRYTLEDSVYVAPGMRGRGVGGALLDALIARCEAGRWRQMIAVIALEPGNGGNPGSVALHRRAGFRRVGALEGVGFKFGRWLDTVFMQRPLGAAATTPPDVSADADRPPA